MEIEIYKDLDGYLGRYKIGSQGNVLSLHHRNGARKIPFKLKLRLTDFGYPKIMIDKKGLMVHRLVAKTFIPNIENKPFVNHINGDRTDNRVENLEWVTNSENQLHSYRVLNNKNNNSGVSNRNKKNVIQYDKNNTIINEFTSIAKASRDLNIHRSLISYCISGKIKHAAGYIFKRD